MHSRFSPSQLHRIITCPASVKLCENIPEAPSSPYAEEGTLLHGYMEQIIAGKQVTIPDAAHRSACKKAEEYVKGIIDQCSLHLRAYFELPVALHACAEVYGTADVVLYDRPNKTLHVLDYKFGEHILVSAVDNPQFMAYAQGAIDSLNIDTADLTIYMHVVQPRKDNYEAVQIFPGDLKAWVDSTLMPAVIKANSKDQVFGPEEEACRWCKAKASCPARYSDIQKRASEIFSVYEEIGFEGLLTPEKIAAFYENAAVVKAQIKAVEDHIMAELLRGTKIPGYKLVRARGKRTWKSEAEAMKFFSDNVEEYDLDLEDVYETKILSPAKLEKVCSKLKKDQGFQSLLTKTVGSISVAPETDAREDIQNENPFEEYME